jgi:lysozyme
VKAGDTLSSIALEFDLTWTALATANNMSDTDFLQIGQVLRIPGQAAAATTTLPVATATPRPAAGVALPTATPAASLGASTTTTSTVTATATATRTPSGKTYTVADGDTVISIALANNVDWQEMLEVNGLTASSILQVGQVLKLP